MKKHFRKLINNTSGETLVEVLVATMIVLVASAGLALMVNVSTTISFTTDKSFDANFEANNQVAEKTAQTRTGSVRLQSSGASRDVDVYVIESENGDYARYELKDPSVVGE